MPDDEVVVSVNGRTYRGWKSVSITRSMEALSSAFSISLTDIWSPNGENWPIVPGDAITIELGGKTVLVGFVDDAQPDEQFDSRTMQIVGRDKLMDLVDCSENITPGQFRNQTALQIAQRMVKSFGLGVRADVSVGDRFERFAIQPGETAHNTISRAAEKRSLLPISADAGETVLLTQAGNLRAADSLILGVNIKGVSARHSMKNRFSEYTIKGQSNVIGSVWGAPSAFAMKATAKDEAVLRFRPKVIQGGGDNSLAEMRRRVQYEASVRAGKATRVTVVMNGWRQTDGELWPVNALTSVKAQTGIQVDQEMLIAGTNFILENGGAKTVLSIIRPDAFLPKPLVAEKEPVINLGQR